MDMLLENDGNFGEVINGTDIRPDSTHLSLYDILVQAPSRAGFCTGNWSSLSLPVQTCIMLWVCSYWKTSVRPSVCRRHGFRSISQVCFGISISNFMCMLMVAIGRSLLIFSDVTFKMAALQPYFIFWFPDSNFTLALNINFKLQRHNTYVHVYG